jgi:hypothetical protein
MKYGFKAVNDGHVVQIDDTYPVMQLMEQGQGQAGTAVMFSQSYTGGEPPWLFLRGGDGGYLLGLKFLGGPGNWTGFRMDACSSLLHNHGLSGRSFGTWQFMVGQWEVRPSTDVLGMRIWDGGSRLLYDAGVRYIKMMYQFQSWSHRGTQGSGGWLFYQHGLALPPEAQLSDPSNYLMINPFVRESFNMLGGDGTSYRKVGPLNTGTPLHVTRSMYTGFSVPYIHPGIIGRASN